MRLLHLQTFTSSHSASWLLWNWHPWLATHRFSTVSSATHAAFTSILNRLGWTVPSSSSSSCTSFRPLSDMLHSHYTINIHLYKLVVNFKGEKFHPYKLNQTRIFSVYQIFQCCCHYISTYPQNKIWPILAPSVACYPYYKCCLLPKCKTTD
jgi:hypothetical protein